MQVAGLAITSPATQMNPWEKPWLGRQDSNLGMPVPKTGALPLGDAPTRRKPDSKGGRHGQCLTSGSG